MYARRNASIIADTAGADSEKGVGACVPTPAFLYEKDPEATQAAAGFLVGT